MSKDEGSVTGALHELLGQIQMGREDTKQLSAGICAHAVDRNSLLLRLSPSIPVEEEAKEIQAAHRSLMYADGDLKNLADTVDTCFNGLWGEVLQLIEACKGIAAKDEDRSREWAVRLGNSNARISELEGKLERLREHACHNAEVRQQVWAITDGKCFYCEVTLVKNGEAETAEDKSRNFHIDHLVAKENGGPDHISNYVPACQRCNISKSSQSFIEFTRKRQARLQLVEAAE